LWYHVITASEAFCWRGFSMGAYLEVVWMNYPFSRVLRHFEPCIIPIWLRLAWMGGMIDLEHWKSHMQVDRNSGIEWGQSVISKNERINLKHVLFVLPDWMLSISVYCSVILRLMENLQNYYPGIHYY
jgi:hypothetical protein